MYFYQVGYYEDEEQAVTSLVHNKKYNKEEFFGILKECFLEAVRDEIKHYDSTEMQAVREKFGKYELDIGMYFDILYDVIIKELCNRYGFRKLEYEEEFIICGRFNLLNKEKTYRRGEVESECFELRKYLLSELNKDEYYKEKIKSFSS